MICHYKSIPLLLFLLLLTQLNQQVKAQDVQQQPLPIDTISSNCDCGYNDPKLNKNWNEMWYMNFDNNSNSKTYIHKDLFFSNYTIPAKFNDSYARVFKKENVVIKEDALQVGITIDAQNNIKCGGIGTTRQDFLYGSYRSFIKTSTVPGSVAAMFIYHPQGEIDIEFVASVKPSQAYFAMHPGITDSKGGASPLTHGNYIFGFDPTIDYHEYRIDWFPNLTVFYVDTIEAYRMTTNVLSQPSRFMFNHWTDGNKKFSQGPVQQDSFIHIKNMTFFFNSSTSLLSAPKCINVDSTCNIEKILASLKDRSTVFDSYLTNNKTTSQPSYTSLQTFSSLLGQSTNDVSPKSASLSSPNSNNIQTPFIYLFITFIVTYCLL